MSEKESDIIIEKMKTEHNINIPKAPNPQIITESFSYQQIRQDSKDDDNDNK